MTPLEKLINFVEAQFKLKGIRFSNTPISDQQIIGVDLRQPSKVGPLYDTGILFEDDIITVYEITAKSAGLHYGSGTSWCIAKENSSAVYRLAESGPTYVAIPKNPTHLGEKFAFQFPSADFRNELQFCIFEPLTSTPYYIGNSKYINSLKTAFHSLALLHSGPEELTNTDYIKSKLDLTDAVFIDMSDRSIFSEIFKDPINHADIIDYLKTVAQIKTDLICKNLDDFYTEFFSTKHIDAKKIYVVMTVNSDRTLPFYHSVINLEN
jgi:hypothetical protein